MATPIKQGVEFRVNAVTQNVQDQSDVAALSDGRFVVLWRDGNWDIFADANFGIRGQMFYADGSPSGDRFVIQEPVLGFVGGAYQPTAAGLLGGGFLAGQGFYNDGLGPGGGNTITFRSLTGGNPPAIAASATVTQQTPASAENAGAFDPDAVQLIGGRIATVWAENTTDAGDLSGSSVHMRLFDAGLGTVVGDTVVNTVTAGDQKDPAVASLLGGGYVVAWQDDSDAVTGSNIFFQRYDVNGVAQGVNTLAHPVAVNGAQQDPAVDGLANGGFVIVEADRSSAYGDASGSAIVANLFNASGGFVTSVQVNTTTSGDQTAPAVVGLADGRFFVAWVDGSGTEGAGGSGTAIRGQLFQADGSKDGSEILVNTFTANDQLNPAVAVLHDGRLLVTWDTKSGALDPDTGVSGQILDPRGTDGLATAARHGVLAQDEAGHLDFLEFTGTQLTQSSLGQTPLWRVEAQGDFNNDGRIDLVTQDKATGQIDLVFLDNQGGVQASALLQGSYWHVVGAGDFDGSGRVGIATQNQQTGEINLLTFTGTQLTASHLLNGTYWGVVGVADVNEDGRADFVTQETAQGGRLNLLVFNGSDLAASALTDDAYWAVRDVQDTGVAGRTVMIAQDVATGQINHMQFDGATLTASLLESGSFPGLEVVAGGQAAEQIWHI